MKSFARIALPITLLASAATVACTSGTPAAPAAEGTAAAAEGTAAAAEGTAAAAAPADPNAGRVAAVGVAGTYTGTLNKGGTEVPGHQVTVMTDRAGAPQVGFWESCNVDMVAEGSGFVSAPNMSCFVDLGTGSNQAHNIASGSATIADGNISATITFENGTVWSFTGTRCASPGGHAGRPAARAHTEPGGPVDLLGHRPLPQHTA